MTVLETRIYSRILEKQTTSERSMRRSQVGTSGRSEKIRTYNYQQDRVTDHRISRSIHDMSRTIWAAQISWMKWFWVLLKRTDKMNWSSIFWKFMKQVRKKHHDWSHTITHFIDNWICQYLVCYNNIQGLFERIRYLGWNGFEWYWKVIEQDELKQNILEVYEALVRKKHHNWSRAL